MIGWTAIIGTLLRVALESGGVKKLQEFFTRNYDELTRLRKTRREPGKTAPPPEVP